MSKQSKIDIGFVQLQCVDRENTGGKRGISHNYKRESLNLRAIFLGDFWTNQGIWYTNSIQNFMQIDMTWPDFPKFAYPLNN